MKSNFAKLLPLIFIFNCNYPLFSICKTHELLFRNITILLDKLLLDYDKGQHPNLKLGVPTTIRTNILIRYFHNGKKSYIHTITLPNKLLRINQKGEITYSMRLTIKAKCPMCLQSFPFDSQSCPLILGSFAYNSRHIVYVWDKSGSGESVSFVPGLTLSQFDLTSSPYKNFSLKRKEGNHIGEFSVLQVNFSFARHKGYFLIQVYVPCVLIVVLSWVSFWLNREATADRVALGITAFLTLSTLSLDSRIDLPKVHYATALDTFLLMCFAYCMATLLEFAGVHYFTKIGSGEVYPDETLDTCDETEDDDGDVEWVTTGSKSRTPDSVQQFPSVVFNDLINIHIFDKDVGVGPETGFSFVCNSGSRIRCGLSTSSPAGFGVIDVETPTRSVETKETQTERKISCLKQFYHCVIADEQYKREKLQLAILDGSSNSVSRIDRISRIFFPLSFLILNVFYWIVYAQFQETCAYK